MILYICKICGYFRDMTPISGPLLVFLTDTTKPFSYNHTVTHCPHGHGEMYQVQKGDRLAVREGKEE